MKRLLRPIFNRIARSLGVNDLQTIASQLDHRVTANLRRLDENLATQHDLRRELGEMERLVVGQTDNRFSVLESRQQSQIADLIARIEHLRTEMYQHIDALTTERLEHLRTEMYQHVDALTTERSGASSSAAIAHAKSHAEELADQLRRYIDQIVAQLRRDVDGVRGLATQPSAAATPGGIAASTAPIIDEALYVALEDRFRGEQKTIRERQLSYLPLIESINDLHSPVIDFGCGRGEWLEILRESGIAARGIDSNRVCVQECTRKGLDAVQGDLFESLAAMDDESARAITFFQVFEHLPFSRLQEVLRACRRILIPGGILIAEIPNTENLTVAASTFWIDPTHERPLHPQVLKFLAEQTGFANISGIYSSPLVAPAERLSDTSSLDIAVSRIHDLVYGPADFALVAIA